MNVRKEKIRNIKNKVVIGCCAAVVSLSPVLLIFSQIVVFLAFTSVLLSL